MTRAFLQIVDSAAGGKRLHTHQLASAFEVTAAEVRNDAAFVLRAGEMHERDVCEHLRGRHAWDSSVAPYYLKWLRHWDLAS